MDRIKEDLDQKNLLNVFNNNNNNNLYFLKFLMMKAIIIVKMKGVLMTIFP